MSGSKGILLKTQTAHCFHDFSYITLISVFGDVNILCVMDHLSPFLGFVFLFNSVKYSPIRYLVDLFLEFSRKIFDLLNTFRSFTLLQNKWTAATTEIFSGNLFWLVLCHLPVWKLQRPFLFQNILPERFLCGIFPTSIKTVLLASRVTQKALQ